MKNLKIKLPALGNSLLRKNQLGKLYRRQIFAGKHVQFKNFTKIPKIPEITRHFLQMFRLHANISPRVGHSEPKTCFFPRSETSPSMDGLNPYSVPVQLRRGCSPPLRNLGLGRSHHLGSGPLHPSPLSGRTVRLTGFHHGGIYPQRGTGFQLSRRLAERNQYVSFTNHFVIRFLRAALLKNLYLQINPIT